MRVLSKTAQKTALIASVLLLSAASVPAMAQNFTDAQKEELGAFIKDYLMENPKVIFDSVDAYRAQQEMEAKLTAEKKIVENLAYLTRADAPSIGNPNGDITIVEFFDYNCGYCKRALTDLQALVKEDENVRIVFKELPILGPTSKTAASWALAAHKQGKYFDFHVAVMEHRGPKEEAELEKLAKDIGLDVKKMKADANSEEVAADLAKITEISQSIGVSGTPAFIVGSEFLPGYLGEDGLKAAIAAVREKQAAEKNDG